MPLAESLPASIHRIAGINAFELRSKAFREDVMRLIESCRDGIERAVAAKKASSLPIEMRILELEKQKIELTEEQERLRSIVRAKVIRADNEFRAEIGSGTPSIDNKGIAERPYGAFVLYSHAQDKSLASALQKGLERFAKPWYAARSMRVFVDETELSANPSLWQEISVALDRSKYILLLASEASARSKWVDRELAYWLVHRDSRQILIVLTSGTIAWDREARDFDWARTTALPSRLRGAFTDEPLYLDLQWTKAGDLVDTRDPRFENAIASLAAAIHGVSKYELVSQHGQIQRDSDRFRSRVVIGLVVLFLFMLTMNLLLLLALSRLPAGR